MSNQREQINLLIEEFGNSVGLKGMRLDSHGACAMVFDDSIIVNFAHTEEDDRLVLFCYLGQPQGADLTAFYLFLLEANFFWAQTRGATLSIESGSGGVILMNKIPAGELNVPKFSAALETFVNTAEEWIRTIGEFGQGVQTSRPERPAGGIQV